MGEEIYSYSKVFTPKIAFDKSIKEKEEAVLLPFSLKGDSLVNLVSEGVNQPFSVDLSPMSPNGVSKYYSGAFRAETYFELNRIQNTLKNVFYQNCILGFEIFEDQYNEENNVIFLNYILANKSQFMSYAELKNIAKELNVKLKKPMWEGPFDPRVGNVALKDGFFLRKN